MASTTASATAIPTGMTKKSETRIPVSRQSPAANYCFTYNNYTAETEAQLVEWLKENTKYYVVGHEVGEQGTPHLQGYMQLQKKARMTAIHASLPVCMHLEPARGSVAQNQRYCSKAGSSSSAGEAVEKGQRTDLDGFKSAADSGLTYNQALRSYSKVAARYPKFTKDYISMVAAENAPRCVIAEFRPWQQAIMDIIAQPPHDRHIYWVFDHDGGKGKTFLAKHLVSVHGAFYSTGGKSTDIIYSYNGQRIVIFDFVRETHDFVNYGAIESIKNGLMSSNKYESCQKFYPPPHVIVFANFQAADNKLSADRLQLIII